MIDTVIHTGVHSIDRVLQTGRPLVLVFWKRGVGANEAFERTLERLAQRYAGQALIAKVDVDAEQALAQRYHISSVPSLVFVKNGQAAATAAGAIGEGDLAAWLEYLVGGGTRPAIPNGPSTPLQGRPGSNGFSHAGGQSGASAGAPGRASAAGEPLTLTDANFQQVTAAGTVLVDFWAPWCGPCRMIAPSVEQLAKEFQGRAVVGKLNVDENPRTAQQFNVMSIPTLYIFKNGAVVDQIVGAQPLDALRQRLARYV